MSKSVATLRRVVQSTVSPGAGATDQELLLRFANRVDQAAFEALVRRHTGLVLGVCRRALAGTQDAEDACQATFLILARKAKAGRWQPSIANWLYTTARRVSADLRRSAAQRARREGKAAVPESVPPIDAMSGRELLAVVDEELDRLSAIYREPLLLNFQQELSRDEIARRLGIPAGTVKIRLERGRKKLAEALTKRGILLSTGLLTLLAASRAGACPPSFVETIAAQATGSVPPNVAALAAGVGMNGGLKKALVGAVLLAVTAGVGFTPGDPTTAGQPAKPMPAWPAAKAGADQPAAPPVEKPIPVSGRVLNPEGRPVAGAKFAIIDDESGDAVPGVASDNDGRFAFQLPYPVGVRNPRPVLASAAGFGMEWLSEPRADAVFRLVPDQPIAGRVLDLQGKPVAGATVAVHDVHTGPPGAFDGLLKHWSQPTDERDEAIAKLDRAIWNRGGLGRVFQTSTAADGTFALTGLGADRVVTLLVTGPGIADTFADIATRKGFDPHRPLAPAPKKPSGPGNPVRLIGPDFKLVVGPDRPATGVVRDAAGKPVAGVRVTGAALAGELGSGPLHFHAWPTPGTVTDSDGKFTLRGLAKAKGYVLVADPDEGTEHLHRFASVDDTTGFEPVKADFTLPRGVVVTGRVTDAATGAGVPSRVFYRPLEENDLLGKFGGYDPPDYPAPWHRGRDTKTDLQGRYKITVMPGAGVVCFQAYGGSYDRARATKQEIDDGIVDGQLGHFRAVGQGGMYNPEFMHAYKVIRPAADDKAMTVDTTYRPSAPPKPPGSGK